MSVSLEFAAGVVLIVTGWFGLLIAVVHSRRVIGRLTDPATNRPGEPSTVDTVQSSSRTCAHAESYEEVASSSRSSSSFTGRPFGAVA